MCADVLRHVLTEHELLVGEVVLRELRRVLLGKIKLRKATADAIQELLRDQTVVPKPKAPSITRVRDPSDRWILASAVEGGADVLVTGDKDLLDLGQQAPLPIVDPRGFWALARK